MLSPIDAKVIVSPNLWEPQTKRSEIIFTYISLRYKYNSRKEVVDFANAISSLISYEHDIVWFTDDSKKIIWKIKEK